MKLLAFLLVFSMLGQDPPVEKVKSSEVLLDLVVRDKKGKFLEDLRQNEIEVIENGTTQPISSFRLVAADPANPPGLVTIVFDRIDQQRAQTTRRSAVDFIDTSLPPNVKTRVMVAGTKLFLVENFTTDKAALKRAVDRAMSPSVKSLAERSDQLRKELTASPAAEEKLARMSVDTLDQANRFITESGSSSPVISLLHVARAQRSMPGRKLVLYVSNGLYLPPGLNDVLRTTISEANRAGVTFYAIDARMILASVGTVSSRLESAAVVDATRRPETSIYSSGAYTDPGTFRRADDNATTNLNTMEVMSRRTEMNKQSALTDLTENTGGLVITAQNDFNGALKRVAADLNTYYVVSYQPTNEEYDGKFRAISVKLARPGATAQTRSGYFAVPPNSGKPVMAYETPMLATLGSSTLPRDFSMSARALQFESRSNERRVVLTVQTALSNFIREQAPEQAHDKQVYPINLSMMAVLKDASGEIVQKFSENHPLDLPVSQLDDVRKLNVTMTRDVWVAPGRYTLESVAMDGIRNRLSAGRQVLNVTVAEQALSTGSLYLIRQVETIPETADPAEKERLQNDPLVIAGRRVIPELADQLSVEGRSDLSFNLPIFAADPNRLKLKLELLYEGKSIATTTPTLPPPDARGRINFTASIPAKGLVDGNYELQATVERDQVVVQQKAAFRLTGAPRREIADDDAAAIASSLVASDRFSSMAVTAMNDNGAVNPVTIDTLIRDTESQGAEMYRRLGEYTYSLRKVRRSFDKKAKIRQEEFKDFEAYPVRGLHALVQLSYNGKDLSTDRIDADRKLATDILIKNDAATLEQRKDASFWGARLGGNIRGKYVTLLVDPRAIIDSAEFSSPRKVLLEGRETVVADFAVRADASPVAYLAWIRGLRGTIWIDLAEKAMVRLEAYSVEYPSSSPNFVYQQQRIADNLWSPQLIRLNSGGNEQVFNGLNWDAWFEFTGFKKFDSSETDLKLASPPERKPN